MRAIKFRIWHNQLEEMFFVRTLDVFGSVVCFTNDRNDFEKEHKYGFWSPSEVSFGSLPGSYELMQYTGLEGIYEGDIVDTELTHDDEGVRHRFIVVWKNYGFGLTNTGGQESYEDLRLLKDTKVIGNIYANSDLLK